jgi:hypothetical protein
MSNAYDDIINLPHHVSKKHPQMPMSGRIGFFAAFNALSGYDEAIEEATKSASDTDCSAEDF